MVSDMATPASQLLECVEEWSEAIDKGEEIDIIYLDFKAAFDKVSTSKITDQTMGIWYSRQTTHMDRRFFEKQKTKSCLLMVTVVTGTR